jgi:hypothetical protein
MTIGELCTELVTRLTADLRTRFPEAEAALVRPDYPFGEEPSGWAVGVAVAGESWGWVGVSFDPDDPTELSQHQAQKELARAYESVIDNIWPDEDTDPWPRCPKHRDHPLQPRLVRDVASWVCLQDDTTAVPLGSLGTWDRPSV